MGYTAGLVAGIGAGYLLGARAGRTRYEQIKKQSAKAWGSDPVQARIADAAQAVKAKTPSLAHGVVDAAATPSTATGHDDTHASGQHRAGAHRATAGTPDAPAGPPLS